MPLRTDLINRSNKNMYEVENVCLTMDGADSGRVLQNDLDTVSMWESRWDMTFNPSKCQVVRVTAWTSPGGCHQC